ncbi:MAG: restriction endonuclease subunit S [Nostoc sp. NMS4]|nr:restriction endonuclease subunit S [Nostoc sp. NMS4]
MNNLKDGEVELSDLKKSASSKAANLLLKPLDVLFNRTNSIEHVGRTSIWRGQIEQVSFASYLVRLIPDQSKLIPNYLNIWLNLPSTQLLIRRYATPGVQQVNINPTNLRKVLIALPKNLLEQKNIAEILDTVDEAIARTSSLITKLKQTKAGLLQDLLTRGLDEDGQLRDPLAHPEQFKDSPLGQIPKSWTFTEFGALIAQGIQNGIYKPESSYSNDGVPIVRIDGFYDGVLVNQESFRRLRLSETEVRRYALNNEDILINRVNSINFLGKSAIVLGLSEPTVFESNIMRLSLKLEFLLPSYAILLLTCFMQRQLQSQAKSAIAQASINQYDVRSCHIALPLIVEQSQIAEIVNQQNIRIRTEEAYFNKLKLQKQGLMQDLLTGKVRVSTIK